MFLALLVGVPATLVVGPLGSVGTPATLFGAGCLMWWIIGRFDARLGLVHGLQPLHLAVAFFTAATMCSYVVGAMRVTQAVEMRSADRSLLRLMSGLGIMLLASDGLRDLRALDRVLRGVTIAGGVLAGFGLVQFLFGIEVTTYIKIPGLVAHDAAQLIQTRSSFRRVAGTASHPIEFGVTLAMVFPIALHCAMTATVRRRLFVWMAVLIGVAIPTSISRSAMLGTVFAFAVLVAGWSPRRRLNALLAAPVALAMMRLAIPGLAGTLVSLFSGLSRDPSIQGRTDDYAYVTTFIREAPWFGRGTGTFIPELYTTLDNQYLGQIVESGYVGLVSLVVLLFTGVAIGWGIKRRAEDPVTSSLGVSLAAAAIVPLVTFITFDGLAFTVVTGFTFLLLGCAGAARRLYRPQHGSTDPLDDRVRLHA